MKIIEPLRPATFSAARSPVLNSIIASACRAGSPNRRSDFYAGLRYSLSMLLQLPDFIFRSELAGPSADGKTGTLDSYSRATRPQLPYVEYYTRHRVAEGRGGSGELNTVRGTDEAS